MAGRSALAFAGLALALSAVPSSALAEDGFALMDRPALSARPSILGLDTNFTRLGAPLQDGFFVLRFDGHLTFLRKDKKRGLQFVLPLAIGFQGGENKTTIGNFEVGGFFNKLVDGPILFTARAALALPTASSNRAAAATNGVAALGRVGDLVLGIPSTLTARGSLSTMSRRGPVLVRTDFGLDVPLTESSSLIDDLSRSPIARANLAVAFVAGDRFSVGLESINVIGAEDVFVATGIPIDSGVMHQLGLTFLRRADKGGATIVLGAFSDPVSLLSSDDGFVITLAASLSQSDTR